MSTLNQNIQQAIDDFDSIQSAIIEKGVDVPEGTPTSQYSQKISEIETGITPAGTLEINSNGEYDVTQYASADVAVPQPTGTIVLTKNGTYDVSSYAYANLNVSGGDTSALQYLVERTITSVTIPFLTSEIGQYAFNGCVNLTSVTMYNNVYLIGFYAFEGCTNLQSINFSSSLITIDSAAFMGCESLTSADLINTELETIGGDSFGQCYVLATVSLPDTLTEIGYGAFDGTALTDIYYAGTQAQWESITGLSDAGIPQGCTIHYEYNPT